MKARDVLELALDEYDVPEDLVDNEWALCRSMTASEWQLRALLAQTPEGEGVYIAPDGTLMRLMRWGPVPIEEATDD